MKKLQPPTRTALTHDRIVEQALALIEREGLDAFSVRKLGSELGCEAMSIYHYYANKREILSAVADRLMDLCIGNTVDLPTVDRLNEFGRRYRRMALRHPAAFPLVAARPVTGHFALFDFLVGIYENDGYPAEAQGRHAETLMCFLNGALLQEIGAKAQGAPRRSELAGWPRVAAALSGLTTGWRDERLSSVIGRLIETPENHGNGQKKRKKDKKKKR